MSDHDNPVDEASLMLAELFKAMALADYTYVDPVQYARLAAEVLDRQSQMLEATRDILIRCDVLLHRLGWIDGKLPRCVVCGHAKNEPHDPSCSLFIAGSRLEKYLNDQ